MTEQFDAVGPDGKYGRADVAANRIVFDQDGPNDSTLVEVTQPDDLHMVRFVQADRIVNFPGTWSTVPKVDTSGEGYARQFELRKPGERGADESPIVGAYADDPRFLFAAVRHVSRGVPFLSAPLGLVKR